MKWYSAHLVSYVELIDKQQNIYPVYENVVVIRAATSEEAIQVAEQIGVSSSSYHDPDNTHQLTSDGEPARMLFLGVRKLIEVSDIIYTGDARGKNLDHGTEVTYSYFEVDSQEVLKRFANGDPVNVQYQE